MATFRDVRGSELEPVDLLAGGFPCQDLSQAGKRAGIEGDRSGLWFEFARLIGELRPRWVLIENVPGLLDRRAMPRVIGELARLGYVGCWRCLRASEFGASHIRKRVFIVAYRPIRGFGKLREPSEQPGRFADGSHATMADAEHPERQPEFEHIELSRGRIETADRPRSAGEQLDESVSGRCKGTNLHVRSTRQNETKTSAGRTSAMADASNGCIQESGRRSEERNGPRSTSPVISLFCRDYSVCHNPNKCDGNNCWLKRQGLEWPAGYDPEDDDVADSTSTRSPIRGNDSRLRERSTTERDRGEMGFAPGPADPRWSTILRDRPDLAPSLESPVRGMADGFPDWLDRAMQDRTKRLGRLGNAVIPQIIETIGKTILTFDTATSQHTTGSAYAVKPQPTNTSEESANI